jgi:hypothetical protein
MEYHMGMKELGLGKFASNDKRKVGDWDSPGFLALEFLA